MSALSLLLKRDRVVVAAGLAVTALVAWAGMIREASRMNAGEACQCLGMKMGGPDLASWPVGTLLPLFLMWCGMMVAMMLPTAAPMILTFAQVSRGRRLRVRPYVPVAIFVAGYIAVWCAFSAAIALLQWQLHRRALLSPEMASKSALLAGSLLILAGVFQLTPLKHTCLRHCRAPLQFIMTRWREGWRGAFAMGLEHGAFCTGCCWALMALLFIAGVMNILWIAALTLLVGLEKLLPRERVVSSATAFLLLGWGTWVLRHGIPA